MKSPSKPRNAAATRAAILSSARKLFANKGYQSAGVREIARGAGVSAMLVNRYFGSKRGLFAAVVAQTMDAPQIANKRVVQSDTAAQNMAAALVRLTEKGQTPLDGFLIMMHSASSNEAAVIGRRQIEQHHQKVLANALRGRMRAQRAAIVICLVAGFQIMRQVIQLSALGDMKAPRLREILIPIFRELLKPPR